MTESELIKGIGSIVGEKYKVGLKMFKISALREPWSIELSITLISDNSKCVVSYIESKIIDKIDDKLEELGDNPYRILLFNLPRQFEKIEDTRLRIYNMYRDRYVYNKLCFDKEFDKELD